MGSQGASKATMVTMATRETRQPPPWSTMGTNEHGPSIGSTGPRDTRRASHRSSLPSWRSPCRAAVASASTSWSTDSQGAERRHVRAPSLRCLPTWDGAVHAPRAPSTTLPIRSIPEGEPGRNQTLPAHRISHRKLHGSGTDALGSVPTGRRCCPCTGACCARRSTTPCRGRGQRRCQRPPAWS